MNSKLNVTDNVPNNIAKIVLLAMQSARGHGSEPNQAQNRHTLYRVVNNVIGKYRMLTTTMLLGD